MTIPFEQALYEASFFTSKENARYDLDGVWVETSKVVATNGKALYVATVENAPCTTAVLTIAKIKNGPHSYPRPRKSNAKSGSALIEEHGLQYLDTLGTRFKISTDKSFPPYDKVVPASPELTILDKPGEFLSSIKSAYTYGKALAQEHLYENGTKEKPTYKAIFYKNGSLHLVIECALGDGPSIPILHTELATSIGSCIDKTVAVWNPELYALRENPVAIGVNNSEPIVFYYPGRMLIMMPINVDKLSLRTVENYLHWEEYAHGER